MGVATESPQNRMPLFPTKGKGQNSKGRHCKIGVGLDVANTMTEKTASADRTGTVLKPRHGVGSIGTARYSGRYPGSHKEGTPVTTTRNVCIIQATSIAVELSISFSYVYSRFLSLLFQESSSRPFTTCEV